MNQTTLIWKGLLTVALLLSSLSLTAEPLEERVARLERMQDNKIIIELLDRVDTLQREVSELRGAMEESDHTLAGIKKRQRELYLDIDQRISRLERERQQPSTVPDSSGSTTTVPQGGSKQPQPPTSKAEQQEYQKAFNLLRKLRYEQAITAFKKLIKKYPDGRYAPTSQYWMAEANYARREFKGATSDYQQLISRYPGSPKVPEAMLKIGYCYYELKQTDKARSQLQALKGKYPGTTEAGQATELLQRIARER